MLYLIRTILVFPPCGEECNNGKPANFGKEPALFWSAETQR